MKTTIDRIKTLGWYGDLENTEKNKLDRCLKDPTVEDQINRLLEILQEANKKKPLTNEQYKAQILGQAFLEHELHQEKTKARELKWFKEILLGEDQDNVLNTIEMNTRVKKAIRSPGKSDEKCKAGNPWQNFLNPK